MITSEEITAYLQHIKAPQVQSTEDMPFAYVTIVAVDFEHKSLLCAAHHFYEEWNDSTYATSPFPVSVDKVEEWTNSLE